MVVAAPRRNKQALPEGIEQFSLFSSLTPIAPAIPAKRQKRQIKSTPEAAVKQLDIFSLIAEAIEPQNLDPDPPATEAKSKPRRTRNAKLRQFNQLTFDSLATAPAEDIPAVSTGEPLAGGTGDTGGELHGHVVRPDSEPANELQPSVGNDDIRDVEGGTGGGRIYVDKPETEPAISRDFRIRPEHGVGSGGLRQKAHNNIEAIRLLKTLEAENREASEEEKTVLVKYVGWGALAQVFEPEWKLRTRPEWQRPATELKELLTKEEYESAKATTPNAHFTSPMVISAIWQGLEHLGVKKDAQILEPSMGIGHFFGMQPDSVQSSHRTGVELDSVTARIAKKLYPDTKIFAQGFEEAKFPEDYFDAVIGNDPFGDYAVHDPDMKRSLTRSVHDYFFAKSLEKTRPGGVMAFVTSHYTMDKGNGAIRKHLSDKADLMGAVRLPNTAFKDNAGTEVVTDIIFLKKRAVGEEGKGESWQEAQTITLEGSKALLNEYFVRHPEMMLGEMTLKGTMYRGQEPTLTGDLTPELLNKAVSALPEGVYTPRNEGRSPPPVIQITEPERFIGVKDGGYAIVDGL